MRRISLKSTLAAAIIFISPANASESSVIEIPPAIEAHFEALREIKTSNVTTKNAIQIIKLSNNILDATYENLAEKYIAIKQLQDLCLDKFHSFISQNPPSVRMGFNFWIKVLDKCKNVLKVEAVDDFASGKPATIDWSEVNGDRG